MKLFDAITVTNNYVKNTYTNANLVSGKCLTEAVTNETRQRGSRYMENDDFVGVQRPNEQTDVENTKESTEEEKRKKETERLSDQKITDYGQITLDKNINNYKLHLLTIIGEIEGHECLPPQTKTTKYEHILPQLAALEDSQEIDGILILINTIGGAVESGLAIAEMIASLSKPTVSLVIGDSHSIGVPLAAATDYSFIVPTGTMIIHPVRMSGTVIGARQTYDYFKIMQDRILGFVEKHSHAKKNRLEELMFNTAMLSKDLGTILVGQDAVDEGIIDSIGGIRDAIDKLHDMIRIKKESMGSSNEGLGQDKVSSSEGNDSNDELSRKLPNSIL